MTPLWLRRLTGRVRYRVVTFGERFYCEMGPEGVHWLDRPADGRWLALGIDGEFDSHDIDDAYFRKDVAMFDTMDEALEALYPAIGLREYRKPTVRAEFVP